MGKLSIGLRPVFGGKAILPIVLIVMLALSANAQAQGPFGIEAASVFSRLGLDFHEGQFSTLEKPTRWEFTASAGNRLLGGTGILPVNLRWTISTGLNGHADLVNPASLVVDGIDLAKPSPQPSPGARGGQKDKAISIDWSLATGRRIELAAARWIVNPLVVGDYFGFRLDATTEQNGKPISASEQFEKLFIGFGGSCLVPIDSVTQLDCAAATGNGYEFVNAGITRQIRPDATVSVGWQHSLWRFDEPADRRLTIRQQGLRIGAGFRF